MKLPSPRFSFLSAFCAPSILFLKQPVQRTFILPISLLLTCVYISVVFELLCPRSSWLYLKSTPLSNKCVAKLCLSECTPTSFPIFAFSQACSKIAWTGLVDMCFSGFIALTPRHSKTSVH